MPPVPAHHAQAIAATALNTWPLAVGLVIDYLAHHAEADGSAVTFATIHATAPQMAPALLRCDGYGHVTRGCEHTRPDGQPCWQPSAHHLSIRQPGRCPEHLPPLAVGEWVRHPEQPAYGRVTRTTPDGTVDVDYGQGHITLHTTQVPRVPHHIAAELTHGPLSRHTPVSDE